MYKHILIPTDGSESAVRAGKHAIELAKSTGAKVAIVTVSAPFRVVSFGIPHTRAAYTKRAKELARVALRDLVEIAKEANVTYNAGHVEHRHVYQAILKEAATRRCDLIVMGSHGESGVAALVLGSVVTKVLTHATVPVLIVR